MLYVAWILSIFGRDDRTIYLPKVLVTWVYTINNSAYFIACVGCRNSASAILSVLKSKFFIFMYRKDLSWFLFRKHRPNQPVVWSVLKSEKHYQIHVKIVIDFESFFFFFFSLPSQRGASLRVIVPYIVVFYRTGAAPSYLCLLFFFLWRSRASLS